MEAINLLKNIGGVLATVTSIIYAAGYMVLRCRSNALGTDLSFKLLDETYIFAGFRFVLITLVTLLLLSPIILFVKWLTAWAFSKLSTDFANIIEWVVLAVLAFVTIFFLKIFGVSGLLIQDQDTSYSHIQQAVLGGQPLLRLSLTFLTTFVASISFIWLRKNYLEYGFNEFNVLLSIVFFVQLCVLPAFHGALFADHRVRVLNEVPASLKSIHPPVCIVERNGDWASLFGKNEDNQSCLVNIKTGDLNGIPVKRIVNLLEFIEKDLILNKKSVPIIADTTKKSEKMVPKDKKQDPEQIKPKENSQKSFFASIVSFLNITFEAVGSLSDGS
jgi:hypothetical protein